MSIRVVIADDHAIVRSGLEMLINEQEDMEVIGTASTGEEAYEQTSLLNPDIVLMDINMPPGKNGMVTTKQIKEKYPNVKVIILTMHDDREYIFRVLQAGASGYLLKSSDDMDLICAIRTVNRGEAYLYPKATKLLIESYVENVTENDEEKLFQSLTSREQEVLSNIAKGYTNREIGEMLYLSVKTIETHKSKIMEKLQLKTRPELVKFALKYGLLDFE